MLATVLLWVLACLLTIAGIAGLMLPALPGAPLLFAGVFAAAWAEDFAYVGWRTLTVLGGLALLTYALEFAASAYGATRYGASSRAIAGATVGAIVGIFFGLPGVILGPFLGAVAGELAAQRNLQAAGRAGLGATVGLALGVAAKLAVAASMIGIFVVVRLWGAP